MIMDFEYVLITTKQKNNDRIIKFWEDGKSQSFSFNVYTFCFINRLIRESHTALSISASVSFVELPLFQTSILSFHIIYTCKI